MSTQYLSYGIVGGRNASILWTIGIILLLIGLVLLILGSVGHAVGGRRWYY